MISWSGGQRPRSLSRWRVNSTCTGVSFVDSTSLTVCHNARIAQHRVFAVDARRGKTSVGWFYGFKLHLVVNDRGYISQALAEQLFTTQGIALITKVRQNMRERVLAATDKLLLRKRAIIESVNDQLKNICQIEHTRHRSPYNFLAHLLAGLVAYCHQPKKPSLHLDMALDLLAAD